MLKYIKEHEKNKETKFELRNDFSIQKEIKQTTEIIDNTIEKNEYKSKMTKLPYEIEKIKYDELEDYNIKTNRLYILEVEKDKVKYEYLINRKHNEDKSIEKNNNKLIVFNNGAVAGEFLSIIMGTYLKGSVVVADNSQFNLNNWIVKPAVDSAIFYCFDNISDVLEYPERFDIIKCFKKNKYVPKMYIHVNLCSSADNSKQLVPFLKQMEKTAGLGQYNDINVILHYEETKGHEGLNQQEATQFLYNVLELEDK